MSFRPDRQDEGREKNLACFMLRLGRPAFERTLQSEFLALVSVVYEKKAKVFGSGKF